MLWHASPRSTACDENVLGVTLIVTRFPRGFFKKSSTIRGPTILTALGKYLSKKTVACSRVRTFASSAKGMNSVRVNEQSCAG